MRESKKANDRSLNAEVDRMRARAVRAENALMWLAGKHGWPKSFLEEERGWVSATTPPTVRLLLNSIQTVRVAEEQDAARQEVESIKTNLGLQSIGGPTDEQ